MSEKFERADLLENAFLMLAPGEDGLWREYSDEWDLTIHHETEEEFNRTKRMFDLASDDDLISREHLLKAITPKFTEALDELQNIKDCGKVAFVLGEILGLIGAEPGVMKLEEEEEDND